MKAAASVIQKHFQNLLKSIAFEFQIPKYIWMSSWVLKTFRIKMQRTISQGLPCKKVLLARILQGLQSGSSYPKKVGYGVIRVSDRSFRPECRMQKLLKNNLDTPHHLLGTSPKKQREKSISSQRSSNLE